MHSNNYFDNILHNEKGVIAKLDELLACKKFANAINCDFSGKNTNCIKNRRAKLRGRGMDFSEVRNYQAHDEIRHMEWRVTARTGRPHVKLYHEERDRPIILLCDFNPSMYFGTRYAFKSVVAAHLSAIIAWIASKQGDRIGGFLWSSPSVYTECQPRGRRFGVLPLLKALSNYTANYPQHNYVTTSMIFSDMLNKVKPFIRSGSMIILVSDFYQLDENCKPYLSQLRLTNDILAYHICDPVELAPPRPGLYPITDGNRKLLLDTTNPSISKHYATYCQERITNLKRLFNSVQITYTQVKAENNIPQLAMQTFQRGGYG